MMMHPKWDVIYHWKVMGAEEAWALGGPGTVLLDQQKDSLRGSEAAPAPPPPGTFRVHGVQPVTPAHPSGVGRASGHPWNGGSVASLMSPLCLPDVPDQWEHLAPGNLQQLSSV